MCYYSADSRFTMSWRVEGRVDMGAPVRVCSPWSRLFVVVLAVAVDTADSGRIQSQHQTCFVIHIGSRRVQRQLA